MPILYQEALKIIQTSILPITQTQTLPLLKALHRISSADVYAKFALPKHAMSLKEGYAISFQNTLPQHRYVLTQNNEAIVEGEAIRVSTGDFIPEGINAVVAEEETRFNEATQTVECATLPYESQHIKHQGEDIAQGELLLHKFDPISAYKITALSSQGIHRIKVLKKPIVSILSIGEALASGLIANSNAMSLAARVVELGGKIDKIITCREVHATILENLQKLAETSDLVITTGALSSHDAMRYLLSNSVLQPLFHTVRIAPAKPSALTLLDKTPILHLPGLPLSCMLGFEMLGVPLLRQLQHHSCILPDFVTCINQKRFTCKADCMSAIPGYSDGKGFIHAPFYEAGRLNILSQCNGYTLIEEKEVIEEGEEIAFFFFTYPPVS